MRCRNNFLAHSCSWQVRRSGYRFTAKRRSEIVLERIRVLHPAEFHRKATLEKADDAALRAA